MTDQSRQLRFRGFQFGIKWLLTMILIVAAFFAGRNSLSSKLEESNELLRQANDRIANVEKQVEMQNAVISARTMQSRFDGSQALNQHVQRIQKR